MEGRSGGGRGLEKKRGINSGGTKEEGGGTEEGGQKGGREERKGGMDGWMDGRRAYRGGIG